METTTKKELGYLKGCTLCNEGSAQEIDKLITDNNMSKKAAYDKIADDVEQALGYRLFSPASIKKRYLVQTGKTTNNGKVLEEPTPVKEASDKPAKDLKEPSQSDSPGTQDDQDIDLVPRRQYDLKTKAVFNLEKQLKAKDDEMADRVSRKLDDHTATIRADLDNARTALKQLQDNPQTKTVTEPAPEPEIIETLPENTVTKEKYNTLGDSLADLQATYDALKARVKIQENEEDEQSDYERGFAAGFAEAMNTFSPLPATTDITDTTHTN